MSNQSSPSVTVSLAPDGSLEVRLPGHSGTERVIPLRQTNEVNPTETIRRILLSQAQQRVALGTDGAPTRAQVQHWERHYMFPDKRCAFCQFDQAVIAGLSPKIAVHKSSHQFDARYAERKLGDSGVTVRRIPSGSAKKLAAQAKREQAKIDSGKVILVDFDL